MRLLVASRWSGIAFAFAALVAGTGCASSAALRAAEKGDFTSLQKNVAAEERTGRLGNEEGAALARAVAGWEIAKGPKDEQLKRVREVRACARALDGALADRMRTSDAAGAEAALARVEAGEMSAGDARAHAADKDDGWRAVGARGLVREKDDPARQRAYVDPAPAVRRAAMHAALEAKDARDVDALAEAARVDPEPIVRTDAVRALAAIGGAPVVAVFRDLWARADGALREDIATAWAAPAIWSAGGRDELRILVAQKGGAAAIEGAAAVLRGPSRDGEVDASATALLARTIDPANKSSRRDRVHAIAVAPLTSSPAPLLEAIRAAAKDADRMLQVAAFARLLESKPDHDAAVHALEGLAAEKDHVALASEAKLALAGAGDLRVQAWIEADLTAAAAMTRLEAATALASLGRAGRAAPLLADADPSVRTRAACTILLAPRAVPRR